MDPNQCLYELLEALRDSDAESAIERCEALSGWLSRGGFMPSVSDELVSEASESLLNRS